MSNETEYLREIALGANNSSLAQAIVDEMVRRGVGIGGGGSGGSGGSGDASAENQITQIDRITEVRNEIGALDSPLVRAYELSDQNGDRPWNLNSLMRGILNSVYDTFVACGNINFSLQTINNILSNPINANVTNSTPANVQGNTVSSNELTNFQGYGTISNYLLIQNLPVEPTGNLWVGFNSPPTIGSGSICLLPGETFTAEGPSVPGGYIYIYGTKIGMQYTVIYK